jgi:hypothetical protein
MKPNSDSQTTAPIHLTFWQKLGGSSLSISLLLHLVLLVMGVIWVFQIIPTEEKPDRIFSPRPGGSSSPVADSQPKKHPILAPQPLSRITVNAPSAITLPEPEMIANLSTRTALVSHNPSLGKGGPGSGDGKGNGVGKWLGDGTATQMSDGIGTKNPFGGVETDTKALVGTFYDLKQTRAGKPNEISVEDVVSVLNDFVNHGWHESLFSRYFKASQTLYQSKLYIPSMPAAAAPAAFSCAEKVQPSRWAVVYRGMITPPHSGKFRFVGYGDDVLVVRFNGKNVFDHGYYSGTSKVMILGQVAAMQSEHTDLKLKKSLGRNYPMPLPLKTYHYDSMQAINSALGGMAIGPYFEAEAGKSYPVDILLSELPGGVFGAVLMIEEAGVTYQKTPSGEPILPLFRLDHTLPAPDKTENLPPYDPNGPSWKVVSERGKAEF